LKSENSWKKSEDGSENGKTEFGFGERSRFLFSVFTTVFGFPTTDFRKLFFDIIWVFITVI